MPICYIWDQVSLPLNAESLKTWMEVCRALNENQTLRDIRIHFKEHNKNNSFYQLLPDKVKQVKSGPRPACLFVGRKTTMDLYSVEVDNHHSYFNKLFQLKTKKLEFLRDCSWGLWELEDEFIARPNPHLKEIEIHARFSLQRQYIEPELPTWEERYLQKYEKILAQFKILNPNIRLRFHDRETMFDKIPSFDVAYQRIRQLFDNIHKFIDLTVAMDIKVESIYLRNVGVIDLEFPKPQQLALNFNAKLLACRILGKKVGELKNWQDDFTQQMANKLNLYVNERGELVGQWIYKDVVITAREILVFKQTI
ncbi:hypothetical protein M3Y97_01088200 [Aphelenchoides bicaudatus]|nr:hypothetical protein M3Y97_01088200 [Aphelenchoides bicaudatus]